MPKAISFEAFQAIFATMRFMRTNSPFQKERKQTLIWRKRELIKANKPNYDPSQATI